MSPALQTVLALLIVLVAITYLLRSSLRRKSGSGCGSEACACPTPKLRKLPKARSHSARL